MAKKQYKYYTVSAYGLQSKYFRNFQKAKSYLRKYLARFLYQQGTISWSKNPTGYNIPQSNTYKFKWSKNKKKYEFKLIKKLRLNR